MPAIAITAALPVPRVPTEAMGTGITAVLTREIEMIGENQMAEVEKSIEVDVPVRTAYNQWTQFETFPEFMSGVESVTQLDDTHLHWVTNIAGVEREFDAEISEQHPDERVAWHSTGGETRHAGVVTFHRLADDKTRVMVQLEWQPSDLVERVGSAINVDDRRVEGDLERFKSFIEARGSETGAWRGDVDAGR
jgi:uncharacterized membrane protein